MVAQEHKQKKKIQVFLKDDKNPKKFFWPGNSPDLNPIENAWASLKSGFCSLKNPPKTKKELKNCFRRIWRDDEEKGLHLKLVNSFKGRMKKLKRNNYGKINY